MAIKTSFNRNILARFKTKTRDAGEAATDRQRLGRGIDRRACEVMRGKRIPRDEGRLEDSLTNPADPDHVFNDRGDVWEFGSKVPHAPYQMDRVEELTDADRRYIALEAAQEAIQGALKGKGA